MANAPANNPVVTGIQVVGEYMFPGGSNLVKGDFKQAAIHAGTGLLAGALFGPLGLLLVKTNSLSVALTDRGLTENLNEVGTTATKK